MRVLVKKYNEIELLLKEGNCSAARDLLKSELAGMISRGTIDASSIRCYGGGVVEFNFARKR